MAPRLRSLSSEGRIMFNLALDSKDRTLNAHKTKDLRCRIKNCLNFLFSSPDDVAISDIQNNCRAASQFLMSSIFDIKNLPKLIDNFIINVILLILKSPRDSNKVAKFHEAKKNYKLFFHVATKAFAENDHNTAWLLNECLNHFAITNLKIPLHSKRFSNGWSSKKDFKEFFKEAKFKYGTFNSCYRKHINDIPETPSENYLPIVAVLHMYHKRTNEHLKATKSLGMSSEEQENYEKNKDKIENLIEVYSNYFKKNSHSEDTLNLYYKSLTLPVNSVKNPLQNRKKKEKAKDSNNFNNQANFSDLVFLSNEIMKSNPKICLLKNTKSRCGNGWRAINSYKLACKRTKSTSF